MYCHGRCEKQWHTVMPSPDGLSTWLTTGARPRTITGRELQTSATTVPIIVTQVTANWLVVATRSERLHALGTGLTLEFHLGGDDPCLGSAERVRSSGEIHRVRRIRRCWRSLEQEGIVPRVKFHIFSPATRTTRGRENASLFTRLIMVSRT